MSKKKLSKLEKLEKLEEDAARERDLKRKAKGIPVGFGAALKSKR